MILAWTPCWVIVCLEEKQFYMCLSVIFTREAVNVAKCRTWFEPERNTSHLNMNAVHVLSEHKELGLGAYASIP